MRVLLERLQTAIRGRGSLVLIAGEAGIGKTRLAEEFAKLARENGSEVVVGRCVPGVPVPYFPFRDAFKESFANKAGVSTLGLREAASSVETGLKGWLRGPQESQSSPTALSAENESTLHSMLKLLQNLSAKHSLVLILEDLQWSDSASIQLLHFIARNLEGLKILILATYRFEELGESRTGIHPLLEALRIMRREGNCCELILIALDVEEFRLAVTSMLGGPVDPELLQRIAKESGGNPLFAVETVRLLANTNNITLRNGVWEASGKLGSDIPSTIREVILRRVERLPKDERRLINCAAVMGEWFDPVLIEEALSLDKLGLLEKLASIEQTSQLIRSDERVYHFSHEKIQQVVYQEIPPLLRRELHKIVAENLERQTPNESAYGQLSLHFHRAEIGPKCLAYSLLAAQDCLAKFSLGEAAAYFERALSVAGDDPSFLDKKLQALEGLGDAYSGMGREKAAKASYGDFLKLCENSRDRAHVLRKAAEVAGFRTEVESLLDQAEGCSGIDPIEIGRIKKLRGRLTAVSGQLDEAERLYNEAERLFRQSEALQDLAGTLLGLSDLYHHRGLVREAVDKAEEAARLYSRVKSVKGEIIASERSGMLYYHLGLIPEALESFNKLERIGTRLSNYSVLADAHFWRSLVYASIGDFEACNLEARKARGFSLKTESQSTRFSINHWLLVSELRLDRLKEAEQLLQENRAIVESFTGEASKWFEPRLSFDEAEYLAAKKEWASSNEKFRKTLQLWSSSYVKDLPMVPQTMFKTLILTEFGEALEKQGLRDQAREKFEEALRIYDKMGNLAHAKRVRTLLTHLA
jgi:tetratricopeptide (TPR) repeat protein